MNHFNDENFQDRSNSAFIPKEVINHLEQIQRLATTLVTTRPLRRETEASGPPFLAAATATCQPDNCIQDIHGSLGF